MCVSGKRELKFKRIKKSKVCKSHDINQNLKINKTKIYKKKKIN